MSGEAEGEVRDEVGGGGLVDGVVLCPLRRVGAEDDILLLGWNLAMEELGSRRVGFGESWSHCEMFGEVAVGAAVFGCYVFRGSGSDVFARTNSKAGLVRGFG